MQDLSPAGGRRGRRKSNKKIFRQTPRDHEEPMPDVPDEFFYKELMFTRHEQRITGQDASANQQSGKLEALPKGIVGEMPHGPPFQAPPSPVDFKSPTYGCQSLFQK